MSLASNQRGSAVVDFVLVSFPMMFIFVSTISLTLFSYARTVVLDATIEGVRFAALADQNPNSGAERARSLIAQSIGSLLRIEIEHQEQSSLNRQLIAFESSAYLLGLSNPKAFFKVSSLATREVID